VNVSFEPSIHSVEMSKHRREIEISSKLIIFIIIVEPYQSSFHDSTQRPIQPYNTLLQGPSTQYSPQQKPTLRLMLGPILALSLLIISPFDTMMWSNTALASDRGSDLSERSRRSPAHTLSCDGDLGIQLINLF